MAKIMLSTGEYFQSADMYSGLWAKWQDEQVRRQTPAFGKAATSWSTDTCLILGTLHPFALEA